MRSNNNISLLSEVLGEAMTEDHVTVIKALSKPKHDEDLAASLKLKATVVRTLLNDLHIKSLVEYERSKNKKTGWYTYLWKRRDDKLNEYIQSYLAAKLDSLNQQLELEKDGVKFNCGCDHKRVSLEQAMETEFMCPACNAMYVESNAKEISKKIESEIRKIKKMLN